MTYLISFIFAFLFIRIIISLINAMTFHYLPNKLGDFENKSVSILIPARNEEENIGGLLQQVKEFSYPNLEVIVYNDKSTDSTPSIVQSFINKDSKFSLINGEELPDDWLGKNHACHLLSEKANGDVLLFLDADVKVKDGLIERALLYMERNKLDLLSIFPKQHAESIGEKMSVPIMNWILLSLLPLVLIRRTNIPAFSAANGQFMMFESSVYKRVLPHRLFRNNAVEDIAIIRELKKQGSKVDTLLGNKYIECRMYNGLLDSINGFAKNVVQFFGNNVLMTIFFGLITSIAPIVVYFIMGTKYLFVYLAGIVLIRVLVSVSSKQPVVQNVVLLPLQQLVFLVIITRRIIGNKKNNLKWKGRSIA